MNNKIIVITSYYQSEIKILSCKKFSITRPRISLAVYYELFSCKNQQFLNHHINLRITFRLVEEKNVFTDDAVSRPNVGASVDVEGEIIN